MPDASDADLVARAQQGDVGAVGELYDRHHVHIFRYLWSRVGNQQLAEDLAGEVFERMLSSLHRYRSRGVPFRPWLYRIAHNLLVDYHRKQGGREWLPLSYAEGVQARSQDVESRIADRLTAQQVQGALGRLDPAQREVVVLRFLVGLSLREVAAAVSKSVPAVKSLQHRGLAGLRQALEGE